MHPKSPPPCFSRRFLGFSTVCGCLLIAAVWPTTLRAAGQVEELSKEQIAVLLKSENWSAIYLLAVHQSSLHPTDSKWRELANYASTKLPAPRIPQSTSSLADADKSRLKELSKRVGTWTTLPPAARSAQASSLLSEVKKFASDFPDLPAGWILEAQMAVLENRPLEGRIAARNLEALAAWQSQSDSVLGLLAQLQSLAWMPAVAANDDQRQQLSKFSQQLLALGNQPKPLEQLPEVLTQVKAFCAANETLPNGWLLQYHIAKSLSRSLDQNIAKKRLATIQASYR